MKNSFKVIICTMLSLMFCIMSIGYAALTDRLAIFGNASVVVPEGLFIIDIETVSTERVDKYEASFLPNTTTIDATLSKSSRSQSGAVTYRVTVLNNTSRLYAYRGLYFQSSLDGYNGNAYVQDNADNATRKIAVVPSFPNGDHVAPGETLTFEVTYTLGSNTTINYSTDYKTLINFQFGINVDSIEEARDAVAEKFHNILNAAETYEELIDVIDNKYDGTGWKATYIGNVAGSTSDDSVALNTLFAGQLNMVINGVEQPVTVIVKRENIDNNVNTGDDYVATSGSNTTSGYGCEYTLYMTTSNLDTFNQYPPVYAVVYTCDKDADGNPGDWYMIGECYAGTAQVVGYEGGQSAGSFDTGSWRSTSATYSPSENYSYSVGTGTAIGSIVTAVDANATAALEELILEAKTIIDGGQYAGTGWVALEKAYAVATAEGIFTLGADGSIEVDPTITRVKLIPYIEQMNNALKSFEIAELEALLKDAKLIVDMAGSSSSAEVVAVQELYNDLLNVGAFTVSGAEINVDTELSRNTLADYIDQVKAVLAPFEDN